MGNFLKQLFGLLLFPITIAGLALSRDSKDAAVETTKPSTETDAALAEYSKNVRQEYLRHWEITVQSERSIQEALDLTLINLAGGAFALSIAVLQFAQLPVRDLETLRQSWFLLGASLFVAVLGMGLSRQRLSWKYKS